MNSKRFCQALAAAFVLAAMPTAAEDGWRWVAAPYLWGASVKTDLNEDAPPIGNESQFGDIISKIDMAFQFHLEGQGDRIGVFADTTYLSLSDSNTRTGYSSDASLQTTLVEAGGVWNIHPERFDGWDILFGARYIKADFDADLVPTVNLLPAVNLRLEETYTDALLGVRHTAQLSEQWQLISRLDAAWGQSEGAVNASLMAGYRFEKGSLLFGYRYLDMELSERGRSLEVTMSGPVVAFAFGL